MIYIFLKQNDQLITIITDQEHRKCQYLELGILVCNFSRNMPNTAKGDSACEKNCKLGLTRTSTNTKITVKNW